jgi:hypothetical protein
LVDKTNVPEEVMIHSFVVEVGGVILKNYVKVPSGTLVTTYQTARSHITQDIIFTLAVETPCPHT